MQARLALEHGRRIFLHRSLLEHSWARDYAARPGVTVVDSADEVVEQLERLVAPELALTPHADEVVVPTVVELSDPYATSSFRPSTHAHTSAGVLTRTVSSPTCTDQAVPSRLSPSGWAGSAVRSGRDSRSSSSSRRSDTRRHQPRSSRNSEPGAARIASSVSRLTSSASRLPRRSGWTIKRTSTTSRAMAPPNYALPHEKERIRSVCCTLVAHY